MADNRDTADNEPPVSWLLSFGTLAGCFALTILERPAGNSESGTSAQSSSDRVPCPQPTSNHEANAGSPRSQRHATPSATGGRGNHGTYSSSRGRLNPLAPAFVPATPRPHPPLEVYSPTGWRNAVQSTLASRPNLTTLPFVPSQHISSSGPMYLLTHQQNRALLNSFASHGGFYSPHNPTPGESTGFPRALHYISPAPGHDSLPSLVVRPGSSHPTEPDRLSTRTTPAPNPDGPNQAERVDFPFFDQTLANEILLSRISAVTVPVTPGAPGADEPRCPICLEDYGPGRIAVCLDRVRCKHAFCRKCLEHLIRKAKGMSLRCPSCRRNWFRLRLEPIVDDQHRVLQRDFGRGCGEEAPVSQLQSHLRPEFTGGFRRVRRCGEGVAGDTALLERPFPPPSTSYSDGLREQPPSTAYDARSDEFRREPHGTRIQIDPERNEAQFASSHLPPCRDETRVAAGRHGGEVRGRQTSSPTLIGVGDDVPSPTSDRPMYLHTSGHCLSNATPLSQEKENDPADLSTADAAADTASRRDLTAQALLAFFSEDREEEQRPRRSVPLGFVPWEARSQGRVEVLDDSSRRRTEPQPSTTRTYALRGQWKMVVGRRKNKESTDFINFTSSSSVEPGSNGDSQNRPFRDRARVFEGAERLLLEVEDRMRRREGRARREGDASSASRERANVAEGDDDSESPVRLAR
ncbi:hypothetical protein GQ43DRAFT_468164 [Delitschia confertaspora ATCC 74209]|uniref:RING-type domain-containing protein n=1 Tax=Delitschia confertaspora ATCC 74209 TaxID=1513339 RepID=A0A9P4JVV8_9PLEO|nr:hypothetical protein GQ43DRAFT_468164 [Delitschia confertaspora ATCC 74209]